MTFYHVNLSHSGTSARVVWRADRPWPPSPRVPRRTTPPLSPRTSTYPVRPPLPALRPLLQVPPKSPTRPTTPLCQRCWPARTRRNLNSDGGRGERPLPGKGGGRGRRGGLLLPGEGRPPPWMASGGGSELRLRFMWEAALATWVATRRGSRWPRRATAAVGGRPGGGSRCLARHV